MEASSKEWREAAFPASQPRTICTTKLRILFVFSNYAKGPYIYDIQKTLSSKNHKHNNERQYLTKLKEAKFASFALSNIEVQHFHYFYHFKKRIHSVRSQQLSHAKLV